MSNKYNPNNEMHINNLPAQLAPKHCNKKTYIYKII